MAIDFSFGTIRLGAEDTGPGSAVDPGAPFRIAVLGDFSGRSSRGVCETGAKLLHRGPLMIDRDNFDEVMARLGPALRLSPGGPDSPQVEVRFAGLDDFHPDRLFSRMGLFQALLETRERLNHPSTFPAAAAEVRTWVKPVPAPAPEAEGAGSISPASLLDQILGSAAAVPAAPLLSDADVKWNAYIAQIVQPYLVPGTDPEQPELLGHVDEAVSARMKAVLHHPDFQALEAAWRGAYLLVRRLETDEKLKVFLIDISRDELRADLRAEGDLAESAVYRLLVEQTVGTPGAQPWAVLLGDYTFDPTREDAELLGKMAKIARAATAPFLAAASPRIVGCDVFEGYPDPREWDRDKSAAGQAAWTALRALPEAAYLGLCAPRVLLRLPYGKKSDPTESLPFEEMANPPEHEHYLWGNPALFCGLLLGQAYTEAGWGLRPGMQQEVAGLPLHVYRSYGSTEVKPCGEALFMERAATALLEAGLIPILTLKDQDTIRVASFRSLLQGNKLIAGRWGR